MACRWRSRVRDAEEQRYGRGLLGAASMYAIERRMPTSLAHRGRQAGRRSPLYTAVSGGAHGRCSCSPRSIAVGGRDRAQRALSCGASFGARDGAVSLGRRGARSRADRRCTGGDGAHSTRRAPTCRSERVDRLRRRHTAASRRRGAAYDSYSCVTCPGGSAGGRGPAALRRRARRRRGGRRGAPPSGLHGRAGRWRRGSRRQGAARRHASAAWPPHA